MMDEYYGEIGCCMTCRWRGPGCLCYDCRCSKCADYNEKGWEDTGINCYRKFTRALEREEEAEDAARERDAADKRRVEERIRQFKAIKQIPQGQRLLEE